MSNGGEDVERETVTVRIDDLSKEIIERLDQEEYDTKSGVIRKSLDGFSSDDPDTYEWNHRATELYEIRRRVEDKEVREFFYELTHLMKGLGESLRDLELPTHETHKNNYNNFVESYLEDYSIESGYSHMSDQEIEVFIQDAQNLVSNNFRTSTMFTDDRDKWEKEIDRFEDTYLEDDYARKLLVE